MSQRLLHNAIAGIIVVIVLIFLFSAWNKGKTRAQSGAILKNAAAITNALGNFYADQNRYPTVVEFNSPEAMGIYLNPFPPIQLSSKNCTGSLVYKNPSSKIYSLFVCLPVGSGSNAAGWTQFSSN